MIPFLILLAFVLGIIVGSMRGFSVNITHTHKHNFTTKSKPVENSDKPVDYNSSYGDPNVRTYLDQQYGKGEE